MFRVSYKKLYCVCLKDTYILRDKTLFLRDDTQFLRDNTLFLRDVVLLWCCQRPVKIV